MVGEVESFLNTVYFASVMRYIFIIFLLLGACASQSSEIKIGALGPYTGPLAEFGEYMREGFELANEEINANGINDEQISLIYEDDKCIDLSGASSAMKKFKEVDDAVGLVGPYCGGTNNLAGRFSSDNKFFVVSPGDNFGKVGDFMINTRYLLAKEGRLLAELAMQKGGRRVAILYYNNEWGQGYRDAAKKYLSENGGELVSEETYDFSSLDVRSQLLKIKEKNPDALILIDALRGEMFDQVREAGLNMTMFSEWEVERFDQSARPSVEGVYYFLPASGDVSFDEKFKAKYGKDPNLVHRDSYDALILFARALEACPDYSPQCMTDYVTSLKDYQGAGGKLTFDRESWSFDKPFTLKQVKNGKFVEV